MGQKDNYNITLRRTAVAVAVSVAFCTPSPSLANPSGASVSAGGVTFSMSGNLLTITNTPGAIINWQQFSIQKDEITRFIQQNAASGVLNRVIGQNPSLILGQLTSNGRVFLINPSGIAFGQSAVIDVAGFAASTLNISDADFVSGRMRFVGMGAEGKLTNAGTIRTAQGGNVYLIAPNVENEKGAVITSPKGEVVIAAGKTVELVNSGTPDIRVEFTAPQGQAVNAGDIVAASGNIGIYGNAVRNSGRVSASRAEIGDGGKIVFRATQDVTLEATSRVEANGAKGGAVLAKADGTVYAQGSVEAVGSDGAGGSVRILGDRVAILQGGRLDASGERGGGEVLVGGDYQGRNPDVRNAQRVYVDAGAEIRADAIAARDGGKVVVWADGDTRFFGAVSARGAADGKGGFVEVSGKTDLDFHGRIDVGAPSGIGGTVLLDPQNIVLNTTVQTAPPNNANGTPDVAFADAPAAGTTTVEIADIVGFSELFLQATNNITVSNNLVMNANGSLRFEAQNNIAINANVTVSGTGTINLTADSDGSGVGAITRLAAGNTLSQAAGTMTLRAASGITATVSAPTLDLGNSTNGAVAVSTNGAIVQGAKILTNAASTFTTGAGSITLNNTSNDFGAAVSLTNTGANAVAITDASALVLGVSNVGSGTLTVNAGGAITQTGAITQAAGAGAATFSTGAAAITLSTATNNFTGAVSLNNTGANNVAVTDANAIVLGASNVGSGTLAVTATGNNSITQTGPIVQESGALAASFITGGGVITLANAANDFTGAVSLTNTGANAVALTDVNALVLGASSVGSGALTMNAGGAITQSGAIIQAAGAGVASFSAGANAITLTSATNNFTGAVSLNNSGANDVAITDVNAIVLGASSVGSGALTVTANGASTITQTGAIVQAAGAGPASFTTGAGAITLNNIANNFTGAVSLSNTGANAVAITDANALTLGTLAVGGNLTTVATGALNLGQGTVGGNLSANSNANAISQAGALTVTGTSVINAGASTITLTSATNNFTGAVSLTNSGANDIAITDTNAIVLGASNIGSGTLTVSAGAAITQTGAIIQAAGAGAASFSTGAAAITLNTATNNFTGAVSLSNTGANAVAITDANALTLGTLTLGGNLTAIATGALNLGQGAVGGNLAASSNGNAISQAGALTVSGTSAINAGANTITLTNLANDFTGAVALTNSGANSVAITDASALVLGVSNVGSGTLTVNAGGAITQTGAITQAAGAGAATFSTGAAAITLSTATNNFTGAVSLNNTGANNVAVTDANAIVLGASNVGSGTLAVTATGNNSITQTGPIVQESGALAASFITGGGVITLANAANDFTGAVSLTNTGANAVALTDVNALVLGASSVGSGALTVNAGGAITQSGAIVQAAGAGVASFSAGANAITLTSATNNFTGAVSLNNSGANDVAITDVNAIVLGASSVGSGALGITAGGAITQTGVITQAAGAGAVTITATAAATDVLLGSQANNFSGAVSFGGTLTNFRDLSLRNTSTSATSPTFTGMTSLRDVTLAFDGAGISLGAFTLVATGDLSLTAGGAVTQSGAWVVPATTTISAGANAITLTSATNNFTGAVSLNNSGANDVAITDVNAIVLGASSVGSGALTVTANGASTITQTGAIVQAAGAGPASFTTGAGAITLNNIANNFTGAVSLSNTGANAVAITDANALTLGTLAVGGNLTTVATGALNLGQGTVGGNLSANSNANAISQAGALTVTGTSVINAGASTITLTSATNNFTGAVSLTNSGANDIAITDTNAIVLGASNIGSGTLTVSAGAAITQTGAIIQAAGAGAASFSTGAAAITLNTATNNFTGAVSLSNTGANAVAITDANALTLGTLTLGGNLTAIATGALNLGQGAVGGNLAASSNGNAISQAGALTVSGTSAINAGANTITLTNLANDFTGAVALTNSGANSVAITDASALVLGVSNVGSGTLTVNAGGAITQTGAITQAAGAGAATFSTGAAAITLSTATNNFTGAVSLNNTGANNVAVTDANGLNLGPVTTGGSLSAIAIAGNITNTGGALAVAGNSTFTAANGTSIAVDNVANNFGGTVAFVASAGTLADVTVVDTTALNLQALTITGNLSATGLGLTQSGALVVPGSATFNAGAGAITLTNAANNFGGAVSLNNNGANNVAISDANAIILGASSVGSGTLAVTAGGANAILQTGPIVQAPGAGTASFITGAGAITLSNAGNDFTGAVSLTNTGANAVAITDANALTLGTLSVGGSLTVVSTGALSLGQGSVLGNFSANSNGGAVSQSGALILPGTSTINAGANTITLTNASNNFGTSVSLTNTGANNVAVTDVNALVLGASSLGSGTLTVSAGGAITQTGAMVQAASAGVASFSAGTNAITLSAPANDFTGAVSLNNTGANNVTITDANALVLGPSSLGSGNLAVTAGGTVTQTGAITQAPGAGTVTFTATAAATDFLLGTQANSLSGAVIFGGTLGNFRDVSLRNISASATAPSFTGLTNLRDLTLAFDNAPISLPALTVSGDLSLIAGGSIGQSGPWTVPGTTSLVATGAISLGMSNNFGGNVSSAGTSITLNNAGTLQLGATNATAAVLATAGGDIVLNGPVSTSATGAESIVLVATSNFVNNAGAGALSTGAGGQWLVYSTNPAADTRGGLTPDFKQYATSRSGAYAGPGTGNGLIYTTAPTITASLVGTASKVYDGDPSASLAAANYAVSGAIDGDTVVLDNPASGAYADKNVGVGKGVSTTVSIASASSGATPVYGYTLGSTTASGNIGEITARSLAVTASAANKVYDGVPDATVTYSDDRVALDSFTVSGTAVFSDRNFGLGKTVSVTGIALLGADAGNYTFNTAATATADITKRPLTVTAQSETKPYDRTANSSGTPQITLGALQTGDATTTFGQSFVDPNAAFGKTINASGIVNDGNGGANYSYNFVAATGDILKRALTITAQTNTKTYDGTTSSAALPTVVGLQSGDTLTSLTQAYADKNAGTSKTLAVSSYTLNDGFGGGNYTVSTVNNTTGVINPAALTVSANDVSRGVSVLNPPFSATYLGLQSGDSPASLSGSLLFATAANVASPAGVYGITLSGIVSPNYLITFVPGSLTVSNVPTGRVDPLATAHGKMQAILHGPAMPGDGGFVVPFTPGVYAVIDDDGWVSEYLNRLPPAAAGQERGSLQAFGDECGPSAPFSLLRCGLPLDPPAGR